MSTKNPRTHSNEAPNGYTLSGVSTLNRINPDGSYTPALQWVKTKHQHNPDELVQLCRDAFLTGRRARKVKNSKPPKITRDDLECFVLAGDPHFGMHAWAKETGEDWDLDIAERIHKGAIAEALRVAPKTGKLVLMSLGDSVHADGENAATTAGTRVDVDSRWTKVLQTYVRVMDWAIREGLKRHKVVECVTIRGNHDHLTSLVINMILQERFAGNKRVIIPDNHKMMWTHKFGKNLICAMHGDKTKQAQIPALIAHDCREEWGQTKRCHVYLGHVHHRRVAEMPGIELEYCRVLASSDAWHHQQGYRSQRSLKCDVWHRDYGRVTSYEFGSDRF